MKILEPSKKTLEEAVKILKTGGVVICPTDTVYGFLADAGNENAVEYIFKIKKRPKLKPLAVFVRDLKMAKKLAEIFAVQEKTLRKYWPGKYTFILKRKKVDVGRLPTIALRIPKYEFLNSLLKKINRPLAQTSVNISGQPELTKASDIIDLLKNRVTPALTRNLLIIDGGNLPERKPSKVFDLTQKTLTRLR